MAMNEGTIGRNSFHRIIVRWRDDNGTAVGPAVEVPLNDVRLADAVLGGWHDNASFARCDKQRCVGTGSHRLYRQDEGWIGGLSTPYIAKPAHNASGAGGWNSRPHLVSGAWGQRTTLGGTTLRSRLAEVLRATPVGATLRYPQSMADNATEAVLKQVEALYLGSRYCVVPPGDNPSSRRLQTVMISGCVPVVCSDYFALPFPLQISWDASVLRVPEASCDRFIQRQLPRLGRDAWEGMHRNVVRVRQRLAFLATAPAAHGYVVDAMLRELALARPTPRAVSPDA